MKDIELHNISKQFLSEVFNKYKYKEDTPNQFNGRTIFHLYPHSDTYTLEDGHLNGFYDSLFFILKIYNKNNYYILSHKDQIEIELPCRTRLFKDGSTIIIFDTPIKLENFQSITIKPNYE